MGLGKGHAALQQRLVLRIVAAVLTEEAPAGELAHLLLYQLLFVEAIAQAFLQQGGVESLKQLIRRGPLLAAQECGVGLHQRPGAAGRVDHILAALRHDDSRLERARQPAGVGGMVAGVGIGLDLRDRRPGMVFREDQGRQLEAAQAKMGVVGFGRAMALLSIPQSTAMLPVVSCALALGQ
ncbi:hypothetical protein D3C71_1306180 [compost metagenome]